MLVLDATNREPEVLVVAVQERIVVVVQGHAVRAADIALRRTPEAREAALEDEIPTAVPVASRQRREGIGVRTVAATVPAASGLEHLARGRFAADRRE